LIWWIAALILLGLSFALGSSLMAVIVYGLILTLSLSWLMSVRTKGVVRGKRNWTNQTVEIGETLDMKVTLTNKGASFIPWVLIEDLLPEGWNNPAGPIFKIRGKRLRLAMLRPASTVKLSYSLECKRRGFYQVGPMVIESGDIFGFHRRFAMEAPPGFVMVMPKAFSLRGYEIASRRPVGEIKLAHKLFEDPTRIAGVREYRAGDPLNRIHWKASARAGVLQTKIVEPSVLAGATIVLDFHKNSYPETSEPFLSDLAVTCAASMALAVCQIRQQVGFLANATHGAERVKMLGYELEPKTLRQAVRQNQKGPIEGLDFVRVPTLRGDEQFPRIREMLACVELSEGPTLQEILSEYGWMIPADSTLVAIVPTVTKQLAQVLGDIKRKGKAVSVILTTLDEGEKERSLTNLVAQTILEFKLVKSENDIPDMCLSQVDRSAPYALQGW